MPTIPKSVDRRAVCMPSILKKLLMAFSGLVMLGFVFIHMLGNLQMFEGPDAINDYAHFLKTLPAAILWGFRSVLILSLIVHVWMAILITRENRAARPQNYLKTARVRATLASRTMGISGSLILFFIVFHILHFTTRVLFKEYQTEHYYTLVNDHIVFNVYQMIVNSFSHGWLVAVYMISMAFLCLHLTHAFWSMFQTLGWVNDKVRPFLKRVSLAYGLIIFIGFTAIPVGVITGYLAPDFQSSTTLLLIEEQPFDSASL